MLDACLSLYIGGMAATVVISMLNWGREVSVASFLVAHLLWPFSLLWALCLAEGHAGD